jgi:hypothetical protein
MTSLRRYEILLPLQFNDGSPVPDSLIEETNSELEERFHAVSWETQSIRGRWHSGEASYEDVLTRMYVDVPDTPENREFFVSFKAQLKQRFDQLDIWITSHPLDVI